VEATGCRLPPLGSPERGSPERGSPEKGSPERARRALVLPEEQFEADAVSIRCSQAAAKSV